MHLRCITTNTPFYLLIYRSLRRLHFLPFPVSALVNCPSFAVTVFNFMNSFSSVVKVNVTYSMSLFVGVESKVSYVRVSILDITNPIPCENKAFWTVYLSAYKSLISLFPI